MSQLKLFNCQLKENKKCFFFCKSDKLSQEFLYFNGTGELASGLSCVCMFSCVFVTFMCGVFGVVLDCIDSLCLLTYFVHQSHYKHMQLFAETASTNSVLLQGAYKESSLIETVGQHVLNLYQNITCFLQVGLSSTFFVESKNKLIIINRSKKNLNSTLTKNKDTNDLFKIIFSKRQSSFCNQDLRNL